MADLGSGSGVHPSRDATRRARRSRQRGTVMVIGAVALLGLLLFAALAIDVGLLWTSRSQSQNAADSAALAAAAKMVDRTRSSVTLDSARRVAKQTAAANSSVANPSVVVQDQDLEFGHWNLASRVFDTSVDLNDPNVVTGVRVSVRMDGDANAESPAFLAPLVGKKGFQVTSQATAYRGFQGSFDPGEFDLPVAIDSCALTSEDGCGSDFCQTAQAMPNRCSLREGGDATCLEFSSTGEQNACWTAYDGDSSSVSAPKLRKLVEEGNPQTIEAGDRFYLDNGDKSNVTREIREKFYGQGEYFGRGAGEDRYPPFHNPARSDSWVVKLPVVECQDATKCSGGQPARVTGGVCFEIREVQSPPYESDRLIKGRFLCPNSPDPEVRARFAERCASDDDPKDPGGCNFGLEALRPVLVN